MKKYILFSILFFGVLFFAKDSWAANWYADNAASGANNGTSVVNAWRSFSNIVWGANGVKAGDSLFICGTHNEQFVVGASGSAGNYITIRGDCPNNPGVIDGRGSIPSRGPGLFEAANKSYITVKSLKVTGSASYGMKFGVNCNYITVQDCEASYSNDSGIVFEGASGTISNVLVEGCDVHHNHQGGESTWHEALTLDNVNTFTVRNNHVHHDMIREGIDAKYGSKNGQIYNNHVHDNYDTGIYVDGANDIDIFNNSVHNQVGPSTGHGILLGSENYASYNTNNIKIYNNLVYDNAFGGFVFYSEGSRYVENCTLINNTVVNNKAGGVIFMSSASHRGHVFRNNIFWKNPEGEFISYVGSSVFGNQTIDHNLFSSGSQSGTYGSQPVNTSNVGFVNEQSRDFHLQANSPAVDKGSSTAAPSLDFADVSRPQGSAWDIGAYEYGGSAPPPDTTPPAAPTGVRVQ